MLASEQRLVFVGGLHRSGTTPIARILAQHPQIAGFTDTGVREDEGQHLQSVYAPASTYGGPGRFALQPRAHLTEQSPDASPETASRLLAEWMPYWDAGRELLLEKSPPNIVMTRFLQALFPGSLFVMVVRNPMVVALSTAKWRHDTPLPVLVRNWLAAHEILREDAPHVARLHVVQYETWDADPAGTAADLAAFLGLDSPIDTGSWEPGRSDEYVARWAALLDAPGSPGRQGRRYARAVHRFQERVASFGYDLTDPSDAGRFRL